MTESVSPPKSNNFLLGPCPNWCEIPPKTVQFLTKKLTKIDRPKKTNFFALVAVTVLEIDEHFDGDVIMSSRQAELIATDAENTKRHNAMHKYYTQNTSVMPT